jgi:hypothetical protein
MDIDVPEPLDYPGLIDYFDPELTEPHAHISINSVHPRIYHQNWHFVEGGQSYGS